MLCCIDSLTLENFQMADRVWSRPIMHCKPLVIDYVMYAFVLFSWQGSFIPDLHTSIWRSGIGILGILLTNYYLLAPFLKKMAPKTSFQGPLWASRKNFWLKHYNNYTTVETVHIVYMHLTGVKYSMIQWFDYWIIGDLYVALHHLCPGLVASICKSTAAGYDELCVWF